MSNWSLTLLKKKKNWSLTFQLCKIGSQPSNLCVKMVIVNKCWMENVDVSNGLFLILKIFDVTCQLKF